MRIAVIGTGIAGLGAAWLLNRRHDVTVYEKNDYAGGHSNTVDAPAVDGGADIPVDTGFIVYNERTYPNLIGLLDHIGVERRSTEMSFAVSVDGGRLEYGGGSLGALYAQKRNLLNPRFHRMVADILRFYRDAPRLIVADGDGPGARNLSLGEFLARHGYSEAFVRDHLLPMAAAIWSCPVETMMRFPAASFVRFFDNHGLLKVADRPRWWTVAGGSRTYVNRLRADLNGRIRLNAPVAAVHDIPGGVAVRTEDGDVSLYDRVVMACHGDEAHRLLSDRNAVEDRILGSFKYQKNHAVLHGDADQMPQRKSVWSSWNYLSEGVASEQAVSVTYWMNRLQGLDPATPLFVTLNPVRRIAPETIIREFDYDHPIFDKAAVAAQAELPEIQGVRGIYYCGSYCGYGFHEDGLGSAVAVARALGVEAPWIGGSETGARRAFHAYAMDAVGERLDPAIEHPQAAA